MDEEITLLTVVQDKILVTVSPSKSPLHNN